MVYFSFDAVVVGSGAAGYAAACRLKELGAGTVAVVTEDVNAGTSRNTGSDKQTYYKLGLGGEQDSVRAMAEDLFACGAVDGDTALCEAALSARCFSYLTEAGVPFPCSEYGEYAGYKTDHDPAARASSAGPLTSKYMTEALEKRARALGVILLDGLYVIEVLTDGNGVCGVAAVDQKGGFSAIRTGNVILATGGPAGIYADTVYPVGHTGSSALALRAGASLQNLTEWQYGLASVQPRWNVSGSYMQALPRFVSVDEAGEEREFLAAYFASPAEALNAVFLKGYQWPFDAAKAESGSSRVDMAVYEETVKKGRTVYLDYTKNAFGLPDIGFSLLSDEARNYLEKAGAAFGTPIGRLRAMNEPAYALYKNKGVDLTRERLRIALCAQHCNGGVSVNADWETEIPGLFAVGECAGTHGISRPGGSALNAGQVGALRAAQKIARSTRPAGAFAKAAEDAEDDFITLGGRTISVLSNTDLYMQEARKTFTAACAAVRDTDAPEPLLKEREHLLHLFDVIVKIDSHEDQLAAYRLLDTLTVQTAMLYSLKAFAAKYGCSRGGAVYVKDGAPLPCADAGRDEILTVRIRDDGKFETAFRPVRPIPPAEESFEKMWKRFREKYDI